MPPCHSTSEGTPALRIEGLAKRYSSGDGVSAIDLHVDSGEVVALLGPNGSGKTTTLRCAVGLLVPDRGHVAICGHSPGTVAAQQAAAFIPDGPDLYPALTVEEHLRFRVQAFRLGGDVDERVGWALAELDLASLADRLGGALSRGQRQRVMLAGAVVQDAALYLLDEPTAGLDPPSERWLGRWLRGRAERGSAVLLATHSLGFVTRVADRVVFVARGRTVSEDTIPGDEAARSRWREETVTTLERLNLHA